MAKLPFWLKITLFYLLTFLLTGILFGLQVVSTIPGEYLQLPQFGPALATIAFVALERRSVKAFLKEGFQLRLNGYALAMIVVPVGLMLSLSVLTTRLWGVENRGPVSVFLVLSTLLAAACEEIGWRGYLQARLQSRLSPVRSSLVLGVLWGFWHAPKLMAGVWPFAAWLFGLMGLALILGAVYNRSGGSIVAATLVHAAINLMGAAFMNGILFDVRVGLSSSIGFVLWAAILVLPRRARQSSAIRSA